MLRSRIPLIQFSGFSPQICFSPRKELMKCFKMPFGRGKVGEASLFLHDFRSAATSKSNFSALSDRSASMRISAWIVFGSLTLASRSSCGTNIYPHCLVLRKKRSQKSGEHEKNLICNKFKPQNPDIILPSPTRFLVPDCVLAVRDQKTLINSNKHSHWM